MKYAIGLYLITGLGVASEVFSHERFDKWWQNVIGILYCLLCWPVVIHGMFNE